MLSIPLIRRKLVPARLPDPFIPRPKLIARLQHGLEPSCRLTLVCGGPGYGKSTLVAAYLRELEQPSGWYTLDDSDADVATFLTYLCGVVNTVAPGAGDRPLELVRTATALEPLLQTVVGLLAEGMAERLDGGAVIVLDDFHVVSRVPAILDAVGYLVQYMPDDWQLVLTSRETPALPLPQLRVRQQLVELGVRELRFGANEMRDLLQRLSGVTLTDAEAVALLGHTDGWVATVILAAQAVNSGVGEARDLLLRELDQPSSLYDYLAQELFACQPPELQAFLLQTSLLPVLDVASCRDALGFEDAAARIHGLVQANMLFPAEGEGHVYHPSFRRFLQARFETTLNAAERAALCRRVGEYLAAASPDEALGLLLRAGDFAAAERLVAGFAERLIANNQLERLRAEIERFGPERRAGSWLLTFYEGEVQRLWGDFDRALGLFQRAQALAPGGQALGRALAHEAAIWLGRGDARALELLSRAEALFTPGDLLGRAFAANLRGAWALSTNDSALAQASYEQALACYRQLGDPVGQAKVLNNLGLCYTRFGHFDAALANYREAIAQSEAAGRRPYPMTHHNLAAIHCYRGEFATAIAEAEKALELAQLLNSRRDGLYAQLGLGFAYAGAGDWRRAEEHYEAARDGALSLQDKATAAKAYGGLAELALLRGQAPRAKALLEEALALTGLPLEDPRQGDVAILLGAVLVAAGELDEASRLLDRLEAELAELGYRYRHVQVLYYQVRLARKRGDAKQLDARTRAADALAEAYGYGYLAAHERADTPAAVPAEGAGVAPAITIQCFGELRVTVGDRPLQNREWKGFKTKLILAYLLGRPDGVSKDQLTDQLYGEMDTTRTAILVLISRLRHALEPDLDKQTPSRFIHFVDGRYYFNSALPYQLDTQEFEYHCRLGGDASKPLDERRGHWRRALATYRGPYLAELSADGPWIEIERARYHHLAQDAHTALVRSYLADGDDAAALEAAEANLAFDPCCELAHQVKMRCLARLGQREAALRHFTIMKQVLERELGSPPSAASLAIQQSISQGREVALP